MSEPLHLFEGFGIELEYMIVDRDTLAVAPVCDKLLELVAGEPTNEIDDGPIGWSNELSLHVVELKTNGPVPKVDRTVVEAFMAGIARANAAAARLGARLLGTAMHPLMDPATETKLWPVDEHGIYAAYDRAFDCSGHGWGNLQSCHINLPFGNAEEFGRLHAAIRPVLGLLPALAASSPLVEGKVTADLDHRLRVYSQNQRRVPSIIGAIVPEPVTTPEDYQRQILEPMYRDIAPLDPEGRLQHEWLNSRGAIARFERDAIEIRLLDVQEAPVADIAIVAMVTAVVRALAEERWVGLDELVALDTQALRGVLDAGITRADEAVIEYVPLLRALGCDDRRLTAGEVWTSLFEQLLLRELAPHSPLREAMRTILGHGPLAQRLVRALGHNPPPAKITAVYRELADCLADGRMFVRHRGED